MRKKIKYNLGGIPPGGPVRTNWTPSPNATLDFMSGMGMVQPGPVTSGTYGMFSKELQPLGSSPLDAMNQVNSFNLGQAGGPGSGMGGIHQGLGVLEQQLAMPENEFDQLQDTITKAKKAGNMIARGRDAVQHARNVKKAADVASAAGGDVTNLLGNLGAMGSGEVAKQGAKTGVGQFIANAGASKFGTFLSSGAGAAASAGAGILGKAIQEIDKKDGKFSRAGAMGGGALQGAAMGSALGPIGTVAGAAIGAGIGELQRAKFEQNAISEELSEKYADAKLNAKNKLAGKAILKTFPVEGIKEQVYAKGGDTDPPYNGPRVTPEKAMSYKNPQFRQWEPSRLDLLREAFHEHNMKDDGTFENAVEFVDPTGISSWDDAYRASQSDVQGLDQSLDMIGAIPLVSKMGRGVKVARMGNRPVQMTDMAQHYYAPVKRAMDKVNRSDAVEDELNILNGYAYGGHTNNPDYLAEGGEMIQHAPGDLPKTDNNGSVTPVTNTIARINGDKHIAASGGVGMEGKESARIYSDQLTVPKELIKQLSRL
jgi:hypothetical protein